MGLSEPLNSSDANEREPTNEVKEGSPQLGEQALQQEEGAISAEIRASDVRVVGADIGAPLIRYMEDDTISGIITRIEEKVGKMTMTRVLDEHVSWGMIMGYSM